MLEAILRDKDKGRLEEIGSLERTIETLEDKCEELEHKCKELEVVSNRQEDLATERPTGNLWCRKKVLESASNIL